MKLKVVASHEFRTPLSTVLSSASLLAKYTTTEEQEKRTRHIDKIRSSVKHLNDILEDFLSLGKLDEGKVQSTVSEFNLQEFLTDITEELKGLLKNGQYIDLNYNGDTVFSTDKKLLKNVIINLITNAIKFSDENSEITVTADNDDAKSIIRIQDHGIGIGEDDLEHLFSSFFRGANAVNIQGTGLGLHIVKRYLDLIGGEVTVTSQLGQGTIVTIIIPHQKSDI
jgi:signal transduction histidine kinase